MAAKSNELIVTRLVDAPRELVWQAFTDPKHIVNWWGPVGFTTTIHEMDVKPGGVLHQTMHGPDGADYPNKSVFVEVVKPERIVYSHAGGRKGGVGISFITTWTFEEYKGKTRVTIHQVYDSAADRERVIKEFGALQGGCQTLARLDNFLAKTDARIKPFILTRSFDAPRDLVWQAWTERDHLVKWFGPKGFTMTKATLDLRPGGVFHYCLKSPDGMEMWGKFVFRDILPPERIALVDAFSDADGNITRHPMSPNWPREMLATTSFLEHEGKTVMTLTWLPLNPTDEELAAFNAAHESMSQGWAGCLDQLAEYLAKA